MADATDSKSVVRKGVRVRPPHPAPHAPVALTVVVSTFADLAAHLDRTDTVTIITTRPTGEEVATPIWAAVVDGVPYVRPAYGPRTAWYLRARSGRPVAFTFADGRNAERDARAALGDPRLAVGVVAIRADSAELEALDAAFREKYGDSPYGGSIVAATPRSLTLQVQPSS